MAEQRPPKPKVPGSSPGRPASRVPFRGQTVGMQARIIQVSFALRARCIGCTGAFQAPRAGSIPVARFNRQEPVLPGRAVGPSPGRVPVHARGVAQFGSAFDWGSKGRWFKSSRPDFSLSVGTRGTRAGQVQSTDRDPTTIKRSESARFPGKTTSTSP